MSALQSSDYSFNWQTRWIVEYRFSPNELMIYAIIYAFSHDGDGSFFGSLQTLCDCTGIKSKDTVMSVLRKLLARKLITREDVQWGNVLHPTYKVVLQQHRPNPSYDHPKNSYAPYEKSGCPIPEIGIKLELNRNSILEENGKDIYIADALPEDQPQEAQDDPSTAPDKPTMREFLFVFDELYPNKADKLGSMQAWLAANLTADDYSKLVQAVKQLRAAYEADPNTPIPALADFLRARSWALI